MNCERCRYNQYMCAKLKALESIGAKDILKEYSTYNNTSHELNAIEALNKLIKTTLSQFRCNKCCQEERCEE